MKVWTVVACVCTAAMLAMGCNPTARYKVLSFFFDGVPIPQSVLKAHPELVAVTGA